MRTAPHKGKSITHSLIGMEVWYHGAVWRVTGAYHSPVSRYPWLCLRRGLAEALAKPYEVLQAYN